MDFLNARAEFGKQLQEEQSKMSEHEVSWKCEEWAKTLALARLDTRPPTESGTGIAGVAGSLA